MKEEEKRERKAPRRRTRRRKKDFDTFKNESLPLVYKLVNVGVTDPCA
jgi:hypothetical protein